METEDSEWSWPRGCEDLLGILVPHGGQSSPGATGPSGGQLTGKDPDDVTESQSAEICDGLGGTGCRHLRVHIRGGQGLTEPFVTLSPVQTSLCSCPISLVWNHLLSSLSEVILLSLSHLSPKLLERGTHQEEKEAPALVLSIIHTVLMSYPLH